MPPLVPQVEYTRRPAFRLVIGALLGALIFQSGYLLVASILFALVIGVLLLYPFKKIDRELIIWTLLIAIAFGLYGQLRAIPFGLVAHPQTLFHAKIKLLHPIIASAESQVQYQAKVELPSGQWINVQLRVPSPETIPEADSYGTEGVATLDLSPLSSIKNKGYRRYLISQGINAQATVQSIASLTPMKRKPLISQLQAWRYHLRQRFDALSAPQISWQSRGLIYALSLGDRSLLPTSLKQQFSHTGVAHILALSGYHLGVVMWLFCLLIGRILWRYEWRQLRYLLLLSLLIAYTLFSGASTATVRALLMSVIVIAGKLLARPIDPIQLLSLVFVIFLAINPFAYYSLGLLLSLSAVWGIFSFYPLFIRCLNPTNRFLQWLRDLICLTISAQIGVLPLLLLNFGSAPLVFIWSNIPLLFLSSLLIPLALLCFLLTALLGWVPNALLQFLNLLAEWMHAVTNLFSPNPINLTIRFDWIALILYYLIAYLAYRLLHSYTCRLEAQRLIHPDD